MNRRAHTQQCVPYAAMKVAGKVPDEKTFYLIGGPNGSGKTTLTQSIIKTNKVEVLNLDNIAAKKNLSSIDAARQLLKEDLPRVLKSGHSFVLESTLSGTYDARIIKMAHELKYRVVFTFAFLDSVEQNIERVAKRVRMGGHDVNSDIIRRRYEKSLHNFHKIVPLVDKWFLVYNGKDGKSCNVASGTNGKIDVTNKEYYTVFCDNCFDASVRRIMHLVEISASSERLEAEGIGVGVPFCVIEQMLIAKQR